MGRVIMAGMLLPIAMLMMGGTLAGLTRRQSVLAGLALLLVAAGFGVRYAGGFELARWWWLARSEPAAQRDFIGAVEAGLATAAPLHGDAPDDGPDDQPADRPDDRPDDRKLAGVAGNPAVDRFCADPAPVGQWHGRVHEVLFTMSGQAAIATIQVGRQVFVGTDTTFQAGTLVEAASPAFPVLRTLRPNQDVWFSGRFVTQAGGREGGGCAVRHAEAVGAHRAEPLFLFVFSDIETTPAAAHAGS